MMMDRSVREGSNRLIRGPAAMGGVWRCIGDWEDPEGGGGEDDQKVRVSIHERLYQVRRFTADLIRSHELYLFPTR